MEKLRTMEKDRVQTVVLRIFTGLSTAACNIGAFA